MYFYKFVLSLDLWGKQYLVQYLIWAVCCWGGQNLLHSGHNNKNTWKHHISIFSYIFFSSLNLSRKKRGTDNLLFKLTCLFPILVLWKRQLTKISIEPHNPKYNTGVFILLVETYSPVLNSPYILDYHRNIFMGFECL